MLPSAARLPDAIVRLSPVVENEPHDPTQVLPVLRVHLSYELTVQVRRVHHLTVDVKLELGIGRVAHADGTRPEMAL